ncbi:putative phage tail protein [Candidatus Regiella insecticola LSR1]|uniref:Putative phage tail protein n=1 Tax=Candidatus Regiella insecticola LSR1 TaxID=663321 RepID=E0WSR7_9ENTR|nr:phage tail protein [Candidatus Regiella insecticola]EFL92036.1 putative phage tail protein [Candidatus Regiella insecticola LSR1]
MLLPNLSAMEINTPPVSYRFAVVFYPSGRTPNLVDMRFQKVSGLSLEIKTHKIQEGGNNVGHAVLPSGVRATTLRLERGMVLLSPLNTEFNSTLSFFQFNPCHVMVTLLNETCLPTAAWLFLNAFPTGWQCSDLDANANAIMIDTFELAYQRLQVLRV